MIKKEEPPKPVVPGNKGSVEPKNIPKNVPKSNNQSIS